MPGDGIVPVDPVWRRRNGPLPTGAVVILTRKFAVPRIVRLVRGSKTIRHNEIDQIFR